MANFPSSSTGFGLNKFENTNALGSTTISGSLTAGSLSISVSDPTNVTTWPTANFVVRINNELIFVDSRSSSTLTVNASGRGYNGTTATTHSSGDTIRVVASSKFLQVLAEETEALTKMFVGETDGDIQIGTGNVFVRQSSDGFVGIRKASPGSALDVNGQVTATSFSGDGSALTGITGATGGISNTGSTTVAADTDEDGSGVIAFQTRNRTRFTVENNGRLAVNSGSMVWSNLGAGSDPVIVSDAADQRLTLTGVYAIENSGAGSDPTLSSNSADQELDLNGTLRLSSGSLVWTNAGAGDDPYLTSDSADQRLKLTGKLEVDSHVGFLGGSSGEIQFNDGSDGFAGDSNLFWDNTEKWLNVGTSSTGQIGTNSARAVRVRSSNSALLALESSRANGDDQFISVIDGIYLTNTPSPDHRHVAQLSIKSDGGTANERGGAFFFRVKPDGSTSLAEAMRISSDRNVDFSNTVTMGNLPTSDPANAGELWNDAGTLKVSSG